MQIAQTYGPARTIGASIIVSIAVLSALAGCAATPPSGPTLVQTKSAAQLLMREAVGRVPAYMVAAEETIADQSEGCDAEDAAGLMRAWRSTATVPLRDNASVDPAAIVTELIASFGEQGWKATGPTDAETVELANGSSPAVLRFTTAPLESGSGGSLIVEALGVCVLTEGAESDEVVSLENRAG